MTRKRTHQEIMGKLRDAGIVLAQDRTLANAYRRAELLPLAQGIKWFEERSGAAHEEIEKDNAQLRRVVSGLTLEKLILQEAARGNF